MSVSNPTAPYPNVQPAQQTSLGQQAHGLQPESWIPTRGLVLRSSLPLLPKDAFTIAQNIRWNGVVWTTQNIGWTQQRASKFGNGAIVEQAIHWNSSGQPLYVHQAGTQVQTYDPTQTIITETTLFTAGGSSIPCMRSFSPNYFLYVNGVDVPQKWNGSIVANSFVALASFPLTNGGITYTTPTLVEVFNNRAVFSGFSQDPFAVIIGDFGNPDSITIDAGTPVATHGGIYHVPSQMGPVTSVKAFQVSLTSNQQVLLVGCQNGFAIITGLDATSFQMVAVQANKWGIPSNRAWFTIDTTTFALCTDGIRPFNGNAYLSNLVSSALSFPVHPLITGWNSQAQGAQAFCLDNPGELECTFYFCTGGDTQNRTAVIMNYQDINDGLVRFSTKKFPSIPPGSTTYYSPACGIAYKGKYFGGGYDGLLQSLYTSSKFNGIGADYSLGSPLFLAPTPSQEAQARGFWILSQGDTTLFTATAYGWVPKANGKGVTRKLLFSQQLGYNTDGTTGLGTTCALGSAQFGGSQWEITPFFPAGGARAWEMAITGNTNNGDLNLVGIFATLIGGGTRQ